MGAGEHVKLNDPTEVTVITRRGHSYIGIYVASVTVKVGDDAILPCSKGCEKPGSHFATVI